MFDDGVNIKYGTIAVSYDRIKKAIESDGENRRWLASKGIGVKEASKANQAFCDLLESHKNLDYNNVVEIKPSRSKFQCVPC